jgi:hypothetical protein
MSLTQHSAETAGSIAAKTAAPITVSTVSLFGVPVPEIILIATLIYTFLLIIHKLWNIYVDIKNEVVKDHD